MATRFDKTFAVAALSPASPISFCKKATAARRAPLQRQTATINYSDPIPQVADLLSKRRNRSVARPRQLAMTLAKELTNHSLPEIGDAFGGRDHTTVIHACRKIAELRKIEDRLNEDFVNIERILTN